MKSIVFANPLQDKHGLRGSLHDRLLNQYACLCFLTGFWLVFIIGLLPSTVCRATRLPEATLDQKAVDCLNRADWHCVTKHLGALYFKQGPESNLQYYVAHGYRQLAGKAFKENDLQGAVDFFLQATGYVDDDPSYHADLGHLYLHLSQYDLARDSFLQAVAFDEQNPKYHELLGVIEYRTGDLNNADYYWHRSLELDPNNKALYRRLHQLKQQQATEHNGSTEVSHSFRLTFDNGMNRDIHNQVWQVLEDAWYQIGFKFGLYPKRQVPVLLLTEKKFTFMTDAPTWASGVYEGQIKIPVADYHYNKERLREVIVHEYVHAVIHDTMADRCPWWLNEGLAQYLSMEDSQQRDLLRFAGQVIQADKEIDLDKLSSNLSNPKKVKTAYALALSATEYLVRHYGLGAIQSILFSMEEGAGFAKALRLNSDYSFSEFQENWCRDYL